MLRLSRAGRPLLFKPWDLEWEIHTVHRALCIFSCGKEIKERMPVLLAVGSNIQGRMNHSIGSTWSRRLSGSARMFFSSRMLPCNGNNHKLFCSSKALLSQITHNPRNCPTSLYMPPLWHCHLSGLWTLP